MAKNGTTKNADGFIQKYKCKCGYMAQEENKKPTQEKKTSCKDGKCCNKEDCVMTPN